MVNRSVLTPAYTRRRGYLTAYIWGNIVRAFAILGACLLVWGTLSWLLGLIGIAGVGLVALVAGIAYGWWDWYLS